jgi:hypothetical protein
VPLCGHRAVRRLRALMPPKRPSLAVCGNVVTCVACSIELLGRQSGRYAITSGLLEQGVDVRVIQTLLGHVKLDTTALYTRIANTTIRAVTSPLDRLASSIEERPRPEA